MTTVEVPFSSIKDFTGWVRVDWGPGFPAEGIRHEDATEPISTPDPTALKAAKSVGYVCSLYVSQANYVGDDEVIQVNTTGSCSGAFVKQETELKFQWDEDGGYWGWEDWTGWTKGGWSSSANDENRFQVDCDGGGWYYYRGVGRQTAQSSEDLSYHTGPDVYGNYASYRSNCG
ncbi:hypothetical protein [Streptosporangium jomthongense]|uniref:hypothetical protein n=1 Tax=Streptosporangium jomthongense TaxID=1193683 RepID=UPI0036DE5F76